MDKKIESFVEKNEMHLVAQFSRDQYKKGLKAKDRIPKYYTVTSQYGEVSCVIYPDCTYEQFLERMLSGAIEEAERLSLLCNEIERDYNALCDDYTALKEEYEVE